MPKKPNYDTLIAVLKNKKNEAVGYVGKVVSDQDDIGASIIAAADFAKKQFEGMSVDVPGTIASKIGYSRSPNTRKSFENYHDEVSEKVASVVWAGQSYAVCATFDAIIEDLEAERS